MSRTTPLQTNKTLTHIAEQRADYLCNHEFSHKGWLSYYRPFSYIGENLSKDFTPKEAHEAFMKSKNHKANITNPHYQYIGLATKCDIIVEEFGGK